MSIKQLALFFSLSVMSAFQPQAATVAENISRIPAVPYESIQEAITAATSGETILVYPGTHFGQLTISNKPINLVSKYYLDGNVNWRDQTILDGNQVGGIISIPGTEVVGTYKIIGFTLRNAKNAPALNVSNFNIIILKQCIIENNSSTIANKDIINIGQVKKSLFEGVIIRNNNALANVMITRGVITFKNMKIYNNTAQNYIILSYDNLTMENVLICDNTVQSWGAPFYRYGSGTVMINHSTIAGNNVNNKFSGDNMAEFTIINSIIWGNGTGAQIEATNIKSLTIKNTAVMGNNAGVVLGNVFQSDISVVSMADPLFIVNSAHDYELSNGSPCFAQGTITSLSEDIRGVRRPPVPKGSYPDLGAYENLSNDNVSGALNLKSKVIYPTINDAVSMATAFDTIIAFDGTHTQTLNLNKSLTIASWFIVTGDITSMDNTVFNGQLNHPAIVCESPFDNNYQIIGITFKNGYAINGGAVSVNNQKSLFVKKCVFDGNSAPNAGAALSSLNTEKVWIEDCIFKNNSAGGSGIICVNDNTNPSTHLTTMRNVLIYNNNSTKNTVELKSADIDNLTLVNNTAPYLKRALVAGGRCVDINNTIIWNTETDTVVLNGSERNSVSNSCIRGGVSLLKGNPTSSSNIISANPLFVNTFHLSNGSPCVGTGGPSPTANDLDGLPRAGKYTDMGCYENSSNQNYVAENITKGGVLYTTLTAAVAGASNGDSILIYPGIYKGLLDFSTPSIGIKLVSMFYRTGDSNYIANTILDGEKKGRTVHFSTHYESLIDGFTVTGGSFNGYGAAICGPAYSEITIKNCIIQNSIGTEGIVYTLEKLKMENTIVKNNSASTIVHCRNSNAELLNCRITHNVGTAFNTCACPNDPQSYGVKLQNVLIDNNVASTGFIVITAQATELNHVVVANNSFSSGTFAKGSFYVNYGSDKDRTISVKNCIFWNPQSAVEINWVNPVSSTLDNSVIRNGLDGNGNVNTSVINIGSGIPFTYSRLLSDDPLFVESAAENFHLQSGSSLIDAGMLTDLQCDFDKNTRPNPATLPDIGCYEHNYIDTGKNMIPVMTSNTAPWGIVNYSSSYDPGSVGWRAFDGDDASGNGSRWVSSTLPAFISFEFPYATPVVRYFILPDYSTPTRTPKTWTFQAFNETDAEWITLDSRSNMRTGYEWGTTGLNLAIPAPGLYKKYRLFVTQTNGAAQVAVRSLKLYGPKDICPVMSSGSNNQITTTASSQYSSTYPAWKAFDGEDISGPNSRWISNTIPAWICAEFTRYKNIKAYYIQAEYGLNDRAPKNWTLEGWNDTTSSWVTIDSRTNVLLANWTFYGQYFKVTNPGFYKKFRLSISAVNGSSVVSICKIKFFEQ